MRPAPPEPERYLSRKDLAHAFSVHPDTIKRWTRAGMPHVIFMSRTVRYLRSEAEAWARDRYPDRER